MKRIDTSEKDWQKKMEECMRKKEKFILITTDEKLAKSLEKNEINVGTLKLILFGSSSIAGLSGIAGLAGSTSLMAAADPEPITKAILVVVATICFLLGAYYVYKLVKKLLNKEYKFTLITKIEIGIATVQFILMGEPYK